MLVLNDKLIYIRIPKTASTYLESLFKTNKLVTNKFQFFKQSHCPRDLEGKAAFPPLDLPSFAVVRHPLDWYYSYFHFMLRNEDVGHKRYITELQKKYRGISVFHVWLHEWLTSGIPYKDNGRIWRMEEERPRGIGPYTWTHCFLTCKDYPTTSAEYHENCLVNHFCKMENLEAEVTSVLDQYDIQIDWRKEGKSNARAGKRPNDYLRKYTPDLYQLLRERDSIIFENYYPQKPKFVYNRRYDWQILW